MRFFLCLLVLSTSFLVSGCEDILNDSVGRFAYHLQGTWVSNDTYEYSGTLKISNDRITISGYDRSQTLYPWENDELRPFKNFLKNIALKGYSEDQPENNKRILGHIYIEDAGIIQEGIPYTYWYDSPPPDYIRIHFLRFTFGGRQETLQRID